MTTPERPAGQRREIRGNNELTPTPGVVDALRGSISDLVVTRSRKRGEEGQMVTVRLVEEGSGQFGLTDRADNREWSGIFNHSILTARYSVHLAHRLLLAEQEGRIQLEDSTRPDTQTILDAMVVSHAGRRSWDEANWYPDAVPDAQARNERSNETQGLQIIEGQVPTDVFQVVAALAHNLTEYEVDPNVLESLTHKISHYVDHRTTQRYQPLHTRMAEFLELNFFDRGTVDAEKREELRNGIKEVIDKRKQYKLGESSEDITLDDADALAEQLGAKAVSPRLDRKQLMSLILDDADMESMFLTAGINPDDINETTVPMPAWERKIRYDYVNAARDDIVGRLRQLKTEASTSNDQGVTALRQVAEEFPLTTWWGQTAAQIYKDAA
jgi:hypothetical protein